MSISFRNIGANALSILSSDAMNRATSFVLYAMVARRLGPFEFGQLSLALTLFYVFQVAGVAGLKILTVREVAKDRSQTVRYLVNGCMIVCVTSLISLAALFTFLRLAHYEAGTSLVILLLSLGVLPSSISAVCEGIFQAWERMRFISIVNVPTHIAKTGAAYMLLSWNCGLYTVILVLLTSFFVVAAVELCLALRRFPAPRASIDFRFALRTLRSASTFMGIDGMVAIESSLSVIFLSRMATEREVGVYSSAMQLMAPLALVYQSIAQSIFPVMCRKVEPGLHALKEIAECIIELLLTLAVPTAVGVFFLSQWGLSSIYRNRAFLEAAPALRIMAWIVILQVFPSVLGQVLMATHREKITLRMTMVNVGLNLVGGWLLIGHFGLRGAAVMVLVSRLSGCLQHFAAVFPILSRTALLRSAWKPAMASICMGAWLAFMASRLPFAATAVSATFVYGAMLLLVSILDCGGIRQFRDRLVYARSGCGFQRRQEIFAPALIASSRISAEKRNCRSSLFGMTKPQSQGDRWARVAESYRSWTSPYS